MDKKFFVYLLNQACELLVFLFCFLIVATMFASMCESEIKKEESYGYMDP
jgi:hypothetical protein